MAKIKKVFEPIIALLEANLGTTAEELLPQAVALAEAKVGGGGGGKASTFHRNEAGDVTAVFCYYFKKWFKPSEVEFGAKKNSASGLNSMCKVGLSAWNKQQAALKKLDQEVLELLMSEELAVADAEEFKATRTAEIKEVVAMPDELASVSYDDLEQLLGTE